MPSSIQWILPVGWDSESDRNQESRAPAGTILGCTHRNWPCPGQFTSFRSSKFEQAREPLKNPQEPKRLFCEAKRAFPPTWKVLGCGKRVWKRENNPHRRLHLEAVESVSIAGAAQGFKFPAPACHGAQHTCAALRFGLLLSAFSKLTRVLLAALFRRIKLWN
jgi:hypothetical protein